MKKVCTSLRALKLHEFHCTLRHIKATGENWHSIYSRLGELISIATGKTIKSASSLIPCYLLLSTFGDLHTVSITFQNITASIPTSYVAAIASIFLFLTVLHFQTAFMLVIFRVKEARRLKLYRFSANAYGFFHGQDEMALATPIFVSSFIREKFPIAGFLSNLMLMAFLIGLLPVVAFWGYLVILQVDILISGAVEMFSRVVALTGLFVLLVSALFVLLFNIPLPVKKNKFGIRWGFLTRLYAVAEHPLVEIWLADDETNSRRF
jgi:hypothetical protein